MSRTQLVVIHTFLRSPRYYERLFGSSFTAFVRNFVLCIWLRSASSVPVSLIQRLLSGGVILNSRLNADCILATFNFQQAREKKSQVQYLILQRSGNNVDSSSFLLMASHASRSDEFCENPFAWSLWEIAVQGRGGLVSVTYTASQNAHDSHSRSTLLNDASSPSLHRKRSGELSPSP